MMLHQHAALKDLGIIIISRSRLHTILYHNRESEGEEEEEDEEDLGWC